MFSSESGNRDSNSVFRSCSAEVGTHTEGTLLWREASSAKVDLHRSLRWDVCLAVDERLPGGRLYSHHQNAREHMGFPRVIQLRHVQFLQSNRIGGVFILGFYIWNVHMSIKCVTLTLLPFEKSGWHQDSCSTDSYQSALLTSILALEGNVKTY